MRMRRILLMVLGFCLGLAMVSQVYARDLTVSAAASLTNAFTELKTTFEKSHPDVTLQLNFAASNPLLKQMQEGAPVDVFASADQETMDKAEQSGVVDKTSRKDFAKNDLVLITPKNGAKLKSLKDLKKQKRIAIGTPESVPAGRYARESLTAAKLWEPLQSKFIYGNNVRQVLNYVARGEVDAGIVYKTDAIKQKDNVDIALVLSNHTPVLYPIAVATTGKNSKDAQTFLDYTLSEEGQAILKTFGFQAP